MKKALWPALVLAALVFARAVTFPFVNWDDPSHFADNPLALHPLERGWSGLFWTREIGYPAPLLQLSFALDMALFGRAAGFWHAENVLLHLGNVAMLFLLARRLGLREREAGASAILFAIHPLVVEPVCWVTGRKDVLSVALVFGACLVATGARRGRLVVANAMAMLAILVLPRMLVAAPFVAVVLHAIGRPRRESLAMLPAFAFACVVVALGMEQVAELGAVPAPRGFGGVVGDVAATWAHQLGHLVLPVDLLAYYHRLPNDPSLVAKVVAALAAAGLAWFAVRQAKPRSPERVGLLLAAVAYAPISCLFAIHRWTADSYMYLPLAGLSIAVVPAVARRFPERLAGFGRFAGYAYVAVLALLALSYTSRWKSSRDVWRGEVERYPDVPLAIEHEAISLAAAGDMRGANARFIELAERFPDWDDNFDDEVRAYEAVGDREAALRVLFRGVRRGHAGCLTLFWVRVIRDPESLGPLAPDLLAAAFSAHWPTLRASIRSPEPLVRIAAALRAAGLAEDARLVDEHRARAFP